MVKSRKKINRPKKSRKINKSKSKKRKVEVLYFLMIITLKTRMGKKNVKNVYLKVL